MTAREGTIGTDFKKVIIHGKITERTPMESSGTDVGKGSREVDLRKSGTTREGTLADDKNPVRKDHFFQRFICCVVIIDIPILNKCPIRDLCYHIRNRDGF